MKSANLTQAEEDAINLHEKEKEEFNQQIASLKKLKHRQFLCQKIYK